MQQQNCDNRDELWQIIEKLKSRYATLSVLLLKHAVIELGAGILISERQHLTKLHLAAYTRNIKQATHETQLNKKKVKLNVHCHSGLSLRQHINKNHVDTSHVRCC